MMDKHEDGSSDVHTERFRELHDLGVAKAKEIELASAGNHGSSLHYGMPTADGRGVVVLLKIFEADGSVTMHVIEVHEGVARREPSVKAEAFTSSMDEHWAPRAAELDGGDPRIVIVGHHFYSVGDPAMRGARGFGGRKFVIRMLATGQIRETTNLWSGGVIPPAWRERMPDNAEFVERSPRTDGVFA